MQSSFGRGFFFVCLLLSLFAGVASCQQDEYALEPPVFSFRNFDYRPGLPNDSVLADFRLVDNEGLAALTLTIVPAFDDPSYFVVSSEPLGPIVVERPLGGQLMVFRDTLLLPARRVPGRYLLIWQVQNAAGVLSPADSSSINIGNPEFPDIVLSFLGRADTTASVPVRVTDTLRLAGQVRVAALPAALRLLAYPATDTSAAPRLIFERTLALTDSLEAPYDVRIPLSQAIVALDTVLTVELQVFDPAQRVRILRRPLTLRRNL